MLGTFEERVLAARAAASCTEYPAIDTTQEVLPDGAFSLTVLGWQHFRVSTTKADGSAGASFGPFTAAGRHKVTHLGLLEPPRPHDSSYFYREQAAGIELVLPALDFPPQCHGEGEEEGAADSGGEGEADGYRRWLGTWTFDWSRRPHRWPADAEFSKNALIELGALPPAARTTDTFTVAWEEKEPPPAEEEEGEEEEGNCPKIDENTFACAVFSMGDDFTSRGTNPALECGEGVDAINFTLPISDQNGTDCEYLTASLHMDKCGAWDDAPNLAMLSFKARRGDEPYPFYDDKYGSVEMPYVWVQKNTKGGGGERCTCFGGGGTAPLQEDGDGDEF